MAYGKVLCGGLPLAKSLMRMSYAPVERKLPCNVLCAGTVHKTFLRECSYARLMRIKVGLAVLRECSYARLMHGFLDTCFR